VTIRDLGAKGDPGRRPSDLDLMLYFDGELDAEGREAVEAFLDRQEAPRRKLAGLELGAELVRERALAEVSGMESIADSVMARIEAEEAAAGERTGASAGADVGKVAGAPRGKPANDNARVIYALAALAVAAAAALVIWGRTGDPSPSAEGPVAGEVAPYTAPASPAPSELEAPTLPEVAAGHGVEIATVDFGARSGSIFYVPNDATSSNATTTVVWLADNSAGEPE
jgi:anti-sigma factor RsiW